MCHVDTFTSNFYPSRQSPDRAPPVGVFDIPKAEPSRRGRSAIGRLRGTHDAANGWWTRRKRGGGLAWFNALERSGRPRPQRRRLPPRVYASTAVASPRSMGCPGVRLQRLRGRGAARRRCYSTPSPPRVASGRRAAPSVSSRSCPAARGARVHVSPRGGSVGVLLHGCPELISMRGSQTKRCAGQNISRGRCASLVWGRVGFMQLYAS
jgi:hypothetical protein